MTQHTAPTVVIAPDSFKGSLSAPGAANAIARGLRRVWRDANLRLCPMADGGEGTLDAVLSRGGSRVSVRVTDASGTACDAAYGLIDAGKTAVIEVAEIIGLTSTSNLSVDVDHRTTLGLGEVIRLQLDKGIRKFIIGLGGSSTNDGGAGLLAALGVVLTDASGHIVPPTPDGIARLSAVDVTALDARLGESKITIISDVNNPLTGERGATAIFGPQKGVAANRIGDVDVTIGRFATLAESAIGVHVQGHAGAGAAGGLGFALQLLGGEMRSGADVVADLIGLDTALKGAHWLITGEGRSDAQTLLGKTPLVAARRAAAAGVPATLLSGAIDRRALPELGQYFAGCFTLGFGPITLEQCIAEAPSLLADRAEQLARLRAGRAPIAHSPED
jgi:glycerate 2-kinase